MNHSPGVSGMRSWDGLAHIDEGRGLMVRDKSLCEHPPTVFHYSPNNKLEI